MPADDLPDDALDIELRPPLAVATRCLILATVIRRLAADGAPTAEAQATAFDLREWLRSESLWTLATEPERAFLMRPAGSQVDDDLNLDLLVADVSALAWTLALSKSDPDDSDVDTVTLLDTIPAPWEKTAHWINAQSPRPEAEIAAMRERAEIWHWRLELEPYRRLASEPDLREIEQSICHVTRDGIAAGVLAAGTKGGFALDGRPLSDFDLADVEERQFLMVERLRALNWVCGYGADWDSVPLDI